MGDVKKVDDDILIANILKNQCSKSLEVLTDKHSGIIFNIGKKYCTTSGLDLNELNDNRYWIVFNSVKSFDSSKGSKFSTWLGNQVRFFCLNFKNKNTKLVPVEDSFLEHFLNEKAKKDNSENQKEVLNNIIDLFNKITDINTKNAIYYRYFYNKDRILNYSEIAEMLNVTPQTVLNWHNKFIRLAKKKLTKKQNLINI